MIKIGVFTLIIIISLSFAQSVIVGVALSFSPNDVDNFVDLNQKSAILLANSLYPSYKGYNIQLKFIDISQNSREKLLNLIKSGAIAIIGYSKSSDAVKDVSISKKYKIPFLLTTATNPILKRNNEYVHMTFPSDDGESDAMSKFILKNFKDSKIAFLYTQNDLYCQGLVSRIVSNLKKESFGIKRNDFKLPKNLKNKKILSKTLADIKKYSPNLLVAITQSSTFFAMAREIKNQNCDFKILLSDSLDSEELYQAEHYDIDDDVYLCTVDFDSSQKMLQRVKELYFKTFNKNMSVFSMEAYNSYLIFYNAFKNLVDSKKPITRSNLNSQILNLKDIDLLGKRKNFIIKDGEFFSYKIFKLKDFIKTTLNHIKKGR